MRRQHGIAQAELTSAIYTTIPNLSNWENGRYMPNKEAINRIADFFNVSTDYLLGRTDNPLPNVAATVVIKDTAPTMAQKPIFMASRPKRSL